MNQHSFIAPRTSKDFAHMTLLERQIHNGAMFFWGRRNKEVPPAESTPVFIISFLEWSCNVYMEENASPYQVL